MSNEQVKGSQRIAVSYAVYRLAEEHRKAVVDSALSQENILSAATRNLLRTIVQPIRVDGFRPGKAPLHRHRDFFVAASPGEDLVAQAVLRAWVESQGQLAQRVAGFLREQGLLEGEGDDFDTEIATFRRSTEWETSMAELAERYPEDSEDNLRLMACLVKGALDIDETDDAELEPVPEGIPPVFEQALRALRSEVPGSPLWEYAINHFPQDVQGLLREQQAAIAAVQAERDIIVRHGELLRYFECGLEAKADGSRLLWQDMAAATGAIRRLQRLLDDYATVREAAPMRSEETQRRDRRDALESEIDAALARLVDLEAPPTETDAPEERPAEEPPSVSGEELAAQRAQVERLTEETTDLKAERDRLTSDRDGLAAERDALLDTVRTLEDDLDENRGNAEMWRHLYHRSQMSQEEGSAGSAPPTPESVKHAMDLAEERYPEELEFKLISKSDLTIPFDKPQQVYDALEWLATAYYSARKGESSNPDLDFSLKQACGWRYTPVQSETTMGMYPEYYETRVDGRKRKLEEHIGTGNGHPRRTVRIAFLWDADHRKVVVAYIGRHQRTRAT